MIHENYAEWAESGSLQNSGCGSSHNQDVFDLQSGIKGLVRIGPAITHMTAGYRVAETECNAGTDRQAGTETHTNTGIGNV